MRTIIWSPQAEAELAEILTYFEEQNAGSNIYTAYLLGKINDVSARFIQSPALG